MLIPVDGAGAGEPGWLTVTARRPGRDGDDDSGSGRAGWNVRLAAGSQPKSDEEQGEANGRGVHGCSWARKAGRAVAKEGADGFAPILSLPVGS
jgi:hypothetical protein